MRRGNHEEWATTQRQAFSACVPLPSSPCFGPRRAHSLAGARACSSLERPHGSQPRLSVPAGSSGRYRVRALHERHTPWQPHTLEAQAARHTQQGRAKSKCVGSRGGVFKATYARCMHCPVRESPRHSNTHILAYSTLYERASWTDDSVAQLAVRFGIVGGGGCGRGNLQPHNNTAVPARCHNSQPAWHGLRG